MIGGDSIRMIDAITLERAPFAAIGHLIREIDDLLSRSDPDWLFHLAPGHRLSPSRPHKCGDTAPANITGQASDLRGGLTRAAGNRIDDRHRDRQNPPSRLDALRWPLAD
jgi:hypothetical protein